MKTRQKWDMPKGNRKHHFIPVFILKKWTSFRRDGKLHRHTKGDNHTVLVNPKDVCHTSGLYALPSYDEEHSGLTQNFETTIISGCETVCQQAYKVFARLSDLSKNTGQPQLFRLVTCEQWRKIIFAFLFIMKDRSPLAIINKSKTILPKMALDICSRHGSGYMGVEADRNFATNYQLGKLQDHSYGTSEEIKEAMESFHIFFIDLSLSCEMENQLVLGEYPYSMFQLDPEMPLYCYATPITPNKAIMIVRAYEDEISKRESVVLDCFIKQGNHTKKDIAIFLRDFINYCSTREGNVFFSATGLIKNIKNDSLTEIYSYMEEDLFLEVDKTIFKKIIVLGAILANPIKNWWRHVKSTMYRM